MSLLNAFTGGKSDSATDALDRAEAYFSNIQTPTEAQLTLPKLKEYVEAGLMTAEEAQAYLQQSNAFEDMDIPQLGTAAQVSTLNQLDQIANAGAEGTPLQQAQLENTLQKTNTSIAGQRGAIENAMAAKGVPRALISAALQNQTVGQEAQQAHMDAVNAQGATYQNALNALSQRGNLGNSLQGQQNNQSNTVAQAANAMQQFNAQNQQQAAQFNAGNRQQVNAANVANKQQVSNNNTGLSNARTEYNAKLPQQVFSNQMAKAQGQAGAATNVGELYNQQGKQNAGITAGLINLGTSFIPKPGAAPAQDPNAQYQFAHGGIVGEQDPAYCADGALVMGEENFPGDTTLNDNVPIMASPGEAVIPKSSVEQNPEVVSSLLNNGEAEVVDVQDAVTLLKAMRALRTGAM